MFHVVTEDQLRQQIREQIHRAGSTQKSMAVELGVSPQYLSDVLRGSRPPGPSIAAALGYERVMLYRPLEGRRP